MDIIIQLNFYEYLDYFDYTNLLITSKNFYYNKNFKNDNIYKKYLENKFSKQFVIKAKPIIISYYDCFLRIINFEKILLSYDYELWDEQIYYAFWKYIKLI
jgi:hypothetical protein